MNPRVFIHQIPVSLQGEEVSFEVKIPEDADRITGLHFSITGLDKPLVFRNGGIHLSIGQLKLKWNDKGDWFFAGEVDFPEGQVPDEKFFNQNALPIDLQSGPWQYGTGISEWSINISACNTTLEGRFTDSLNALQGQDQDYLLNVYFTYIPREVQP